MNKNSSDPFNSTFSLLAGQGTTSRPHHALNHVEPMPDSPQYIIVASPRMSRRVGLVGLLMALLGLG